MWRGKLVTSYPCQNCKEVWNQFLQGKSLYILWGNSSNYRPKFMYFLQVLLQVNFTENIYNFYNQNVCSGCNHFSFTCILLLIAIQFYRNFWMKICFWSMPWPLRIFTEAAMIYWYKNQAKPRSKSSRQKSFWSKKVLISIQITKGLMRKLLKNF